MATTNNVILPNVNKDAGVEDNWPQIWALTRAMKKAGWKYLSSSNGSSKDTSRDPALDYWGGGGVTGVSGADGTLGASAGGRVTFTAGSGTPFVAADKGRFMSITGGAVGANNHYHQIEEFISTTVVRLDARNPGFTPTAAGETNNGSLSYAVYDPTIGAASGSTTQKWLLLQGPSTLKIPITAAPVAGLSGVTFIRGENVAQATSGAEGEILGWVYDTDTTTGYLVIAPRVIGTGAGVYGWDTALTVTGATSGSTVDQSGTALEYRHQFMVSKENNATQGWMYHQSIEPVGEAASDFYTLSQAAGCTGTAHPGGGGTGNGFPGLAWTSLGLNDSSSGAKWNGCNSSRAMAKAQIMCADAIWEEDHSADGTAVVYIAGAIPIGFPYGARGVFRLDDTEPGDVDPFISAGMASTTLYSVVARYQAYSSSSLPTGAEAWCSTEQLDSGLGTGHVVFKGWRRRGMPSDDTFITCEAACLTLLQSNNFVVEYNNSDADKVATELLATKSREPIWVISGWSAKKMRKGSLRWLAVVQGGNPNDTYDGGRWVQLHNIDGCLIAGPWDQTTVPTSS